MNGYWVIAIVSLWVLLAAVAVAQVGLLRRIAPLLGQQPHQHGGAQGLPIGRGGIEVGETPGEFRGTTASGAPAGRRTLLGRPTVALLAAGGCAPCEDLIAELRSGGGLLPMRLVVIVDHADDPTALRLPAHVTVIRQHEDSAATAFATKGTPYAFALDASGVVRARGIPQRVADLAKLAAAVPADGQLAPA